MRNKIIFQETKVKEAIALLEKKLIHKGVCHHWDSEDIFDLHFELYGTMRVLELELEDIELWAEQLDKLHLNPTLNPQGQLCVLVSIVDILVYLAPYSSMQEAIHYMVEMEEFDGIMLQQSWYDSTMLTKKCDKWDGRDTFTDGFAAE